MALGRHPGITKKNTSHIEITPGKTLVILGSRVCLSGTCQSKCENYRRGYNILIEIPDRPVRASGMTASQYGFISAIFNLFFTNSGNLLIWSAGILFHRCLVILYNPP
jgi:hypothetical protein